MQLTFNQPDYTTPEWGDLPTEVRNHVRIWVSAFQRVPLIKPIEDYFKNLAHFTGFSPSTAKSHYYALRKTKHWSTLIPRHLLPKNDTECRTKNKEFRNYLVKLAEDHQRNSAAAIRKLKLHYRNGEPIPGYLDRPGWPATPKGWSTRRLAEIIRKETSIAKLQSIRIGVSSKTNPHLPQVFTTRTNLWPGAVYQLDDVWHDNFVTVGKSQTPARVIEIGALDLFSAARIHHGAKPRLKNQEGKYENLREEDTSFFLAALFHGVGYSQRGTMLMAEHGAAAVTERVERILYDATGGLVRLDRQPIEGKQQALTGFWNGTEGGNFRAKAALESSHNPIHNDLAHLALQTGKTSDHRPVATDRQLQYISSIIKEVLKKAPHRAHLLRLPSLDFHSQFVPLLQDYYRYGLNGRTEHNLEGWEELGFLVTKYTAVPGSEQWLSPEQFLSLPPESQAIIKASYQHAPKQWARKRKLSPWEVWSPAASSMLKIPDHAVCEILSPSMAREEKVKGGYLHWKDISTASAELIYEARILTPFGAYRELPNHEKYAVFSNPFEDRWLFVTDASGRYLGKCELVKRVTPIATDVFHDNNPWDQRRDIRSEELKQAAGHKHARIADIQQPVRIRHAEQVQAAKDLREHNRRVVTEEAVTPEEIAKHKDATNRATRLKRKAHNKSRTGLTFEDLI